MVTPRLGEKGGLDPGAMVITNVLDKKVSVDTFTAIDADYLLLELRPESRDVVRNLRIVNTATEPQVSTHPTEKQLRKIENPSGLHWQG